MRVPCARGCPNCLDVHGRWGGTARVFRSTNSIDMNERGWIKCATKSYGNRIGDGDHMSHIPLQRGAQTGVLCYAQGDESQQVPDEQPLSDLNELHTQLNKAIASEDYTRAAEIRDHMLQVLGGVGNEAQSWSKLGILAWLADRAIDLGFKIPTPVQSRSAPVILSGCDCIIQAATGSGKTLAFLLPLLSMLEYPPNVYPEDLEGPQLLIVIPTRELGVQIAMMVFKLFGGSVNPGIPGSGGNMFRYTGPRGLKVKGLVLADEVDKAVEERYLSGAHVVIGTPDLIADSMKRGVQVAQHTRGVCIDEVDACYEAFPDDMIFVMDSAVHGANILDETGKKGSRNKKPIVVLSGATISDEMIKTAASHTWITDPVDIIVGERAKLSPSTRHEYVVVNDIRDKVGALCRCILADQKEQSLDSSSPRAIIFVDDSTTARQLAEPLRNTFWGKHSISVLLPDGAEPLLALQAFRDNRVTVLLATPAAARGLDLPAVTHVYNLSIPSTSIDYIHRTGRMGRIGASCPGVMTTILLQEEVGAFKSMLGTIGCFESFERRVPEPPGLEDFISGQQNEDAVEDAKRVLEALLALSPDEDATQE